MKFNLALNRTLILFGSILLFNIVLRLSTLYSIELQSLHPFSSFFNGLIHDFRVSGLIAVFSFFILWGLAGVGKEFLRVFSNFLFLLWGFILIALNQYYVSTGLLLGADLWGYSYDDIIITIKGSDQSSWVLSAVMLILFIFPFVVHTFLKRSLNFEKSTYFYAGFLILALGLVFYNPSAASTIKESAFEKNKLSNLVVETYYSSKQSKDFKFNGYPLLHPIGQTSNLAPFFNFEKSPNIVFIIVEGLGTDFVNKDSKWGGYMPFLDSLCKQSLYWPNTFSSAGRTFNAIPSILGSLPYASEGFMQLGPKYPRHNSLITYLQKLEYETHYYYGGNLNFDKQDIFLEYEGVNKILNQYSFEKSGLTKSNRAQNSWGFNDLVTFDEAAQNFSSYENSFLDVYLTLTTHEPFICPDSLLDIQIQGNIAQNYPAYKKYGNVFSTLAFTDQSIKYLIEKYAQTPDYQNTLFVITGDHRLIPVDMKHPIERFHVPLILWSPSLTKPHTSLAVNSHLDLTPSLLKLIYSYQSRQIENEVAFLGTDLDTNKEFIARKTFPIMINKNDMGALVTGNTFLYKGAASKFDESMNITQASPASRPILLLDSFKSLFNYTIENNKITNFSLRFNSTDSSIQLSFKEIKFLNKFRINAYYQDTRLDIAKRLSYEGKYKEARAILKYVLQLSPNYTDARILLGRTLTWEGKYKESIPYFDESIRRAPDYEDAYLAYITMCSYAGMKKEMDSLITLAKKEFPYSDLYDNF
jgi:lipoteichoic acid synthase